MNNCYKKKKSLRSRKIIPMSELRAFRLVDVRCYSLERSHRLKSKYGIGTYRDLMDHIKLVFLELEDIYYQMKDYGHTQNPDISKEELFFILCCYNHTAVNFEMTNNMSLFLKRLENLRYVIRRAAGAPSIPPEFLAGVHQVDVYPVHNRGAATIVTQPRSPHSSHNHHVIKQPPSNNKSEREKFLQRKGIIQELSALKAEVDHFQSLLEFHPKSKDSTSPNLNEIPPEQSIPEENTEEDNLESRENVSISVNIKSSSKSSSSSSTPVPEASGNKGSSSPVPPGSSSPSDPKETKSLISRNDSFLKALHNLSEEKNDEEPLQNDLIPSQQDDEFYSHNSDSDDYTASSIRGPSNELTEIHEPKEVQITPPLREPSTTNPSISITPDVVPEPKGTRSARKGSNGGSLIRGVAFDLSGSISNEDEEVKDESKEPLSFSPDKVEKEDMESIIESPLLPKFKIEEKCLNGEGGSSSSGAPMSSGNGILKKPSPVKGASISSSEEALLRSFPSLPHSFLQQLGLHQTKGSHSSYLSTENLSDQDIENKFTSLSLAFKTDKLTLSNRLELQQRHRDTAERNIEEEIKDLKQAIGGLNRLCNDVETREVLQRLTQQVDVLRQSSSRISSAAEVYGAVQQEARIARAIEVMLLHVDNLKRLYEKEHSELEETRRILADHNLSHHEKGRSPSGLPSPDNLLDSSSKFVSLSSNDVSSKSGRMRSVSVINNHSSESIESNPKLRRASYTAVSSTQKSPETLSASSPSSPENNRPRSPTTSIMVHKGQANRKIGVISGGFRKTSHSRTLMGDNSVFSPIAEEGKEYELNGSKIQSEADIDAPNNNNNNNNGNAVVKVKKKVSLVEDPSHKVRTKLYWRSKSTIETSLSSSLASSSSNDEDTSLLDEIDQLAIKRDSSPNRNNFKLRQHLSSMRKKSIIQNVMDWYREFSWPWDWDETVLGFRYCLTGLLSFAAFISLVITFFGGGSGGSSLTNDASTSSSSLSSSVPRHEEL